MKKYFYTFFIIILFLASTQISVAAPSVKLCIDSNCKKPLIINITDDCWNDVKDIFSTPFVTDKDEQDNIVNAIALIEFDLYHSIARRSPEKNTADEFYTDNSYKNNYRNIKNILNVLLDNYMVTRHAMRKTITKKSWSGVQTTGLMLQSLSNGQLFILESENKKLGNSALIKPYKKSSFLGFFSNDDKPNNNLNNDDFE